jgi:hypothetical protein
MIVYKSAMVGLYQIQQIKIHGEKIKFNNRCVLSWKRKNRPLFSVVELQNISYCSQYKLILDLKLSSYSENRILSFGCFPCVWILYADFSEYSVCSIFIGGVSCFHRLWRWNSVPKSRHIKFRPRGIAQKEEYNINLLWYSRKSHEILADSTNIFPIDFRQNFLT